MGILTFALWQEVNFKLAIILGITSSTVLLFLLDRHFVFSDARHKRVTPQIFGFILACFICGALNYFSTIGLLSTFSGLIPQIAEIGGLIIGAIFNYFFLRYFVFKKDA